MITLICYPKVLFLLHHLAQVPLPSVTLYEDGTVNKVPALSVSHFWDDAGNITKFMVADAEHTNHCFGINILSILETIW